MTRELLKNVSLAIVALAIAVIVLVVNASHTNSACNTGVNYMASDGGIICK